MYHQFTSESVAAGHPDKICDQISDAIVDKALSINPLSRVAIETLVTRNRIVIAGEVTCPSRLSYKSIARKVVKSLGYTKSIYNFTHRSPISTYIHQQSPDISKGVDQGGAGDQGMMFGYAVKETKELMPLPIMLAHQLVKTMDKARESKSLPYLRPDGKAEVVIDYKNLKPYKVATIILAVPHHPNISNSQLVSDLEKQVVKKVLRLYSYCIKTKSYNLIINGTGRWQIGGPASDTGVTGRKIIVDTYGGMGRHGGGCFSGKDPTKVDRSGAYACRFLAKNIVSVGLADKCEVKVAYVIGQTKPVSMAISTFNTAKKKSKIIKDYADSILDLSVPSIFRKLKLHRPIYRQTAAYGHFGNPSYPWEKIIK